ncbi:MAG: dicarboxylate/amino acid:cation symporter [Pirellulaceae bacterium]|nr:dicarboxylate/amino acid:cation symporter [Pirellulaceae bacterium]
MINDSKTGSFLKVWSWPLHWQILTGLIGGLLFGVFLVQVGQAIPEFSPGDFATRWVKPFGVLFVNSLKLIAIPLILASLIKGVSDLQDMSRLSSMGGRTIALYLCTTVVAVCIGLVAVNLIGPGRGLPEDVQAKLLGDQAGVERVAKIAASAEKEQGKGPLQALVDIVPENLVSAASSNSNMLQVIFWAIFFGIAMILAPSEKVAPVKAFFDSLNTIILMMIDIIMWFAPVGVFALMASLIAETSSDWRIFSALAWYSVTVILGLAIVLFGVYPTLVMTLGNLSYMKFLRGMMPAQLLAFTTSSSAATLPVTLECVEKNLGVDPKVASFVLPIGATINMDGTSLYQAVAAVFIAQALGIDLSFYQQLTIVVTATLASIGAAAVPGAGMVMLVVVLEAIGVPQSGLALILAVDRVLDMCRTTVNVTGDAAVATIVGRAVANKPIGEQA